MSTDNGESKSIDVKVSLSVPTLLYDFECPACKTPHQIRITWGAEPAPPPKPMTPEARALLQRLSTFDPDDQQVTDD